MSTQSNTIKYCPNCGSDCRSIVYGDRINNKCPYCGHEIYDYSEEIHQEKVEEVKTADKRLAGTPRLAAITIVMTLIFLFAVTSYIYATGYNEKIAYFFINKDTRYYTNQMQKCYEAEDWDGLYKLVILDFEHTMKSEYYFTYRTAWFINYYPEKFDAALEAGNTEELEKIYETIKSDYDMRTPDLFGPIYKTIDEVEEGLVVEYERETEIMEGLED